MAQKANHLTRVDRKTNTINGFNGMPPLGMCMDCGEEEFVALINFMAGQE